MSARRFTRAIYSRRGLEPHWDLQIWLVENVQDRYFCWTSPAYTFSLRNASQRRKITGKCRDWKSTWLCSLWFWSSREAPRSFCQLSSPLQDNKVGRDVVGSFTKKYPQNERLLTHPRRMLISSFFLDNGTIITPLLQSYLDLGLVFKEFVILSNTLQWSASTVLFNLHGTLEERETRIQNVVVETLRLVAISCYGYQIKDWSRYTVTKDRDDEKTDGALNNKMFKHLGYINDQRSTAWGGACQVRSWTKWTVKCWIFHPEICKI